MTGTRPPRGWRAVLWPLELVRHIWRSAVVDEAAVRFNLRLLAALTALFSLPDIGQGVVLLEHATAGGVRFYAAYVLALGVLELAGAVLLARRMWAGRYVILVAAAGFYPEMALALLAGFERSVIAATIFAACVPADAWVIWFLTHRRVGTYVATWRRRC